MKKGFIEKIGKTVEKLNELCPQGKYINLGCRVDDNFNGQICCHVTPF